MTLTLHHYETHTSHMSDEAHCCPKCKAMRYFWINRNGTSFCLYCDETNGTGSTEGRAGWTWGNTGNPSLPDGDAPEATGGYPVPRRDRG